MEPSLKKLIVILGPTASGKTELAVQLAKEFNGEIINADSRQIYVGMDIGTAKPIKTQKAGLKSSIIYKDIPHHLIDIVRPDQDFTLSQYQKLAILKIKDIQSRDKIPFLVGGTGLYIQSVVDNLKIPEVPPHEDIRKELETLNTVELLRLLRKLDPVAASAIDAHNRRRLIRALEVCLATGKPFSQLRQKGTPLFDVLQIGIDVPKEEIRARIDQRVDNMIKQGLIEEVKKINNQYLFTLPAMSSIGYKEFELYLKNETDLENTTGLIKKNTREYAKKQITWFKKDSRIQWVRDHEEAKELLKTFLKK